MSKETLTAFPKNPVELMKELLAGTQRWTGSPLIVRGLLPAARTLVCPQSHHRSLWLKMTRQAAERPSRSLFLVGEPPDQGLAHGFRHCA